MTDCQLSGSKLRFRSLFVSSVAVFLLAVTCRGQNYTGSLTGVVTDPGGEVIPNAHVTLTDVSKGYDFNAATDGTGRYVFNNLIPSTYRLTVRANGFGNYVRDGIVLGVDQNGSADVKLEVGAVSSKVEVTASEPLLATQDATLGQTIDRKSINELPLVGRNVLNLTYLAPGVTPAAGRAYSSGGDVNFISNGGRNATAAIVVDGVTTTGPDPNTGIVRVLSQPTPDDVQEFKIEQGNFRADIGFAGNSVINIVTRSGTNKFHGTAYEFLQNSYLNANNFFNNKNGIPLNSSGNNTFGGVLGGPIKKNRTFFFLTYNGNRSRTTQTNAAGVPSQVERNGNFAELCTAGFGSSGLCNNPSGQLWDPYTGVYNSSLGGAVRQSYIPFNNLAAYTSPGPPPGAGSSISLPRAPGNLIDPVAARMMTYFPLPNVGVGTSAYNPYNNYISSTTGNSYNDEFNIRLDHRFTGNDLLTGKYDQIMSGGTPAKCFNNVMDPCSNGPGTGLGEQLSLTYIRTLSPTTVATVNLGFVRNHNISPGAPAQYPDFNPVTDLGLPNYVTRSGKIAAPLVSYSGGYANGAIGTKTWSIWNMDFEDYEISPNLEMNRGRHDIKIGGTFRLHRINFFQPGVPTGSYNFDFTGSSEFPSTGGGNSLASFLMGTGGGNYLVNEAISTQSLDYAMYVNDTWRVSDRLTLDLGLRYEIAQPETERFNRIDWLNPGVTSPLQVPGLPTLNGGMEFAGNNQRTPLDTQFSNLGPRIGLAYKITDKTVLRAGYGMFYSPSIGDASGITGGEFNAWNISTNEQQYGANQATPYARFSNPYPVGGPSFPPGSSQGLLTQVGQNLSSFIRSWNQIPQTQTWSIGLQRQLPGNLVITANYVGTKGTHLYFANAGNLDILPQSVENLSSAGITALNTVVANPFYGRITDPNSSLRNPTVPAWQLQLPYPQFTGFGPATAPWANSSYNALQLQVDKRFSHGLQVQGAYTWSKSIDDASVTSGSAIQGGSASLQDPNRRYLERSLSQFDVPQSVQIAYTYQLPWGRGRAYGSNWNRWLDSLAGGWETSGIWIFQSGFPIGLGLNGGKSLPTYGGQRPNLNAPLTRNEGSNWMTQYFADPQAVTVPAPYAIGTAPRVLPVRAPGTNNATLALFKSFPMPLGESSKLEFRLEAFNALNHPQFAPPNSTVNTPTFGLITSQLNVPRQVQLGLKLYF